MPTATVGNVKTQRPGIWDMLGRAKWSVRISTKEFNIYRTFFWLRDAWAQNKDLEPYEAKWLYVDAMLKAVYPVSFSVYAGANLIDPGITEVL